LIDTSLEATKALLCGMFGSKNRYVKVVREMRFNLNDVMLTWLHY